ncbi:endonuclease 4 homolog isoform X2 [Protopterus annectens]|uniref:endonuclease 4 homolog isoform X2 n=1 Tax=Protopterus annectens TaxID=7888 RepID=UPI001CFBE88C|nr:endonuclease 4 homolog isoform X2 [Protopterus annectens]
MFAIQLSEPAKKGRRSHQGQVEKNKAVSPKQLSPGKSRSNNEDVMVADKTGMIKKVSGYVNDGEKPSTSGMGTQRFSLATKKMERRIPKESGELSESEEELRLQKVDIRKEKNLSTKANEKPAKSGVQRRGKMDVEKKEMDLTKNVEKQSTSGMKKRRVKVDITQEDTVFKTVKTTAKSGEKQLTSGGKKRKMKEDNKQEEAFFKADRRPSVYSMRKRKADAEEMVQYKVQTPTKKKMKANVQNKLAGKSRSNNKDEKIAEKTHVINKVSNCVNDGEKPSTSSMGKCRENLASEKMERDYPEDSEELSESEAELRIQKVDIRKENNLSTKASEKPSNSGMQLRGKMDVEKEEMDFTKNVEKQSASGMKKMREKVDITQEGNVFKTEKITAIAGKKLLTSGGKKRQKKEENKQEKAVFKGNGKPSVSGMRKRKAEAEEKVQYKVQTPTKKKMKANVRNKYVGAHLSIAGGIWKIFDFAESIGARAIGLFLGSQRSWDRKPIKESVVQKFHKERRKHKFRADLILPHGSYLLNCGSPNQVTFKKSCTMLVDELHRCEQLGLKMFNFHPGSTLNEISVQECVKRIAFCINYAHGQTKRVVTVLENMSCQGNTVGGKFEELQQIISLVKDKSRVGVCIDTCHAFAAGYDLSSKSGLFRMLDYFNRVVGLKYLKAIHLNDSQGKLGCHLDRHENIGRGYIGLEGFKYVMNDPLLNDIPMILETPYSSSYDCAMEIQTLYSLCK